MFEMSHQKRSSVFHDIHSLKRIRRPEYRFLFLILFQLHAYFVDKTLFQGNHESLGKVHPI